jgi:serine/threonine-protein kinase
MNELLEKLRAALAADYAVEHELGSGGMAIVYLAHDIKHEREVAVKVLRPELAASLGIERFLREIKIAAKLSHPHILPLYDSGEADGFLYYVMPFVEGESLGDLIGREKQLSIDEAVQIAREVAEALAQAHSYGIIHRDIKPDNVMISGGHAVVSDFGIARAFSAAGGENLTQTGMAVGTPAYMSPEQAAGDPSVDARADVYSLGCMLYEMLVGQIPFTGPNAQAIMARHTMDTITPPQIMRQSIPDELQDVIVCAMEKTPADRFRTAGEFANALKAVETGTVPAVRKSSLVRAQQAKRPSSWRKVAVPIVSALAALVLGAGGWQLLAKRPELASSEGLFDPRRIAVLYFQDLSPAGELQYVADGLTEGLIDNLSQVRSLDVVSRNGVAPYRRGLVPSDSVARILRTGSLIAGSVIRDGDNVRVTAQLIEGTSGADFDRASFELPESELLSAQDSVAEAVSLLLRQRLGEEVRVRQRRANTESTEAWALVLRSEQLRKDARNRAERDEREQAILVLQEADSLAGRATQADRNWVEPVLLHGWLAHDRARLEKGESAVPWIEAGLEDAERALEMVDNNPGALALRGTLKWTLFSLQLTPDQREWEQLLFQAKEDLEAAVAADPSLAEAQITLSYLYYQPQVDDVPAALLAAQRAYEEDAYLDNADAVLDRMFWSSLDLENFSQARRWCGEGDRRYPGDFRFNRCQLWLLASPAVEPDPDRAAELVAALDTLTPAARQAAVRIESRMVLGGALARAGFADSALGVLERARTQVTHDNDPHQRFLYVEAIMRSLAGDYDGGIDLLKRYVAAHPDHNFAESAGTVWWYRDLRQQPRWREITGSSG